MEKENTKAFNAKGEYNSNTRITLYGFDISTTEND
jgi:hypothetical protein